MINVTFVTTDNVAIAPGSDGLSVRIIEPDRVHSAEDDALTADYAFTVLLRVKDVEWRRDHCREERGFVA